MRYAVAIIYTLAQCVLTVGTSQTQSLSLPSNNTLPERIEFEHPPYHYVVKDFGQPYTPQSTFYRFLATCTDEILSEIVRSLQRYGRIN